MKTNEQTPAQRTNARTNERTNELTNVWTTPELGYMFAFMYFVDDVVGGCVAAMVL